jgi:hypothetical protein
VAVDAQGPVYVLDTGTRAVRVFSKRGAQAANTPARERKESQQDAAGK